MDDTHRIVFGPEVGEFTDALRLLSERSLAVDVTLRDGTSFGCVPGKCP